MGADIIAISVDKLDKSKPMADQLKIPFPVLSDPEHKTNEVLLEELKKIK